MAESNDTYVIEVEARTQEAQQQLESVAKATEKMGKASKAAERDAKGMSTVVGQAAEAASSMGGAFGGAGRMVQMFSATLRALKLAMAGATGGISLLIGAITAATAAVIGLFLRHKEKLQAFEAEQKKVHAAEMGRIAELNNVKLQAIQREFEKTTASSNALLASLIEVDAANRKFRSAKEQAELSTLDLEEQKALAGVVGDTGRQSDVKQTFAFRRAEVSRRYKTQTLEADVARASNESKATGTNVAMLSGKLRSQETVYREAETRRQTVGKNIENQKALLDWMKKNGREFIFGKGMNVQKEGLTKLEGEYAGLTKSLQTMRETMEATRLEMKVAVDAQTVAMKNGQAARLQLQTHITTSAKTEQQIQVNAIAERQATKQREQAEAQRKAAERQARIVDADAVAAREAADVTNLQTERQSPLQGTGRSRTCRPARQSRTRNQLTMSNEQKQCAMCNDLSVRCARGPRPPVAHRRRPRRPPAGSSPHAPASQKQ